jgi:hypothetical protein
MKKGWIIALVIVALALGAYLFFRTKINNWLMEKFKLSGDVIKSEVPGSYVTTALGADYVEPKVTPKPKAKPKATPTGGGNTDTDFKKILRIGSKGNEVKLLQQLLNKNLGKSEYVVEALKADGSFGPKTEYTLVSLIGRKETTLDDAYALLKENKAYTSQDLKNAVFPYVLK